jgi:hypothetical protein
LFHAGATHGIQREKGRHLNRVSSQSSKEAHAKSSPRYTELPESHLLHDLATTNPLTHRFPSPQAARVTFGRTRKPRCSLRQPLPEGRSSNIGHGKPQPQPGHAPVARIASQSAATTLAQTTPKRWPTRVRRAHTSNPDRLSRVTHHHSSASREGGRRTPKEPS